ncbi:cell adhesion molecule CEACAM21-like isoform X1 [Ictidomys tridecemlineatus]
MQPPSACPCRGGIPWQGVLLAVSLLTFWNPHPTAPLTIEPVPFDAAEGRDVLLLIHNASQNTIGYNWFKGKTADISHDIISYVVLTQTTIPGPAFSGGEKIYSNGSLLLHKVTQNNRGFYTLQTVTADARVELATGEFRVHGLVAQPSLRATNTEPHSVAMTCLSGDPGISITWIFNSQTLQLTDRMQLSPDHRTLSIDPVRQEDAGEYQCEASNPASSTRSDRYRLAVISEERTPGLPLWAVAGIVTGVLVGVALVAALGCFLLHTRTGRAGVQQGLRDHRTPASTASECPFSLQVAGSPRPAPQCHSCSQHSLGQVLPLGRRSPVIKHSGQGTHLASLLASSHLLRLPGSRTANRDTGSLPGHVVSSDPLKAEDPISSCCRGPGLTTPSFNSVSVPGQGPSDSSTSLAPVSGHKTAVPIYQELINPDLDIYCRVEHTAIGGS